MATSPAERTPFTSAPSKTRTLVDCSSSWTIATLSVAQAKWAAMFPAKSRACGFALDARRSSAPTQRQWRTRQHHAKMKAEQAAAHERKEERRRRKRAEAAAWRRRDEGVQQQVDHGA